MSFTAADFAAFFEGVHGHPPYPWQDRLLSEVAATGHFPTHIDLPTGSGKTAIVDVFAFALALQGAGVLRRVPRRLFFVVDRRVVVDAAWERAQKVAAWIEAAASPLAEEIRAALRALNVPHRPLPDTSDRSRFPPALLAVRLRGGTLRDDAWARTPVQPLVAATTVDQLGSRLLFRGYGVGPYARSIHAGLCAVDSLVVLDEVHLSRPFDETLTWLSDYGGPTWRTDPDGVGLPGLRVVRMTATPVGAQQEPPFRLSHEDHVHPYLRPRLTARKPVELEEIPDENFVERVAARAIALLASRRRIGVVVNRVATARALFRRLDGVADADVVLVIGRSRPIDADARRAEWGPRVLSDRDRSADDAGRPILVVSTQCIEAGADLDFDALITECASWDAVRQRFGRLDRAGRCAASGNPASGCIVIRSTQKRQKKEDLDPVYGEALSATWRFLEAAAKERKKSGGLDLGPTSDLVPPDMGSVSSPVVHAPVVAPVYVDLWSQTCPAPAVDPDLAVFLHGPQRGPPDVTVVWRADLDHDLEDAHLPHIAQRLAAVPPGSGEGLALSIGAVRRWLTGGAPDTLMADVEGAKETEDRRGDLRRVVLRLGFDGPERIQVSDVRPGDRLLVPATWGGCDMWGFAETSPAPVADLGDAVQILQRARPSLRLNPQVLATWTSLGPPERGEEGWDPETLRGFLARVMLDPRSPRWAAAAALGLLDADGSGRQENFRMIEVANEPILIARKRLPAAWHAALTAGVAGAGSAVEDFAFEDDGSALRGLPGRYGLQAHSHDVSRWAASFADRLGLPPELREAVRLAGWLHDLGKADPRFQAYLDGGTDPLARYASGSGLLAKSGRDLQDRDADAAARAASGLPAGWRHEALSLRLIEDVDLGPHRDLVLHLVASHHGRARPFFPAMSDLAGPEVTVPWDLPPAVTLTHAGPTGVCRLDSGVPDRFVRLNQTWGWYGLAFLEALVRLADHRASQEGEPE